MEVDSDEEFQYHTSTPQLPVLSTLWGFRSEPPGMTPPLNKFVSCVPFQWEEVPGKPKHQQGDYCSTSPVFSWNDYHENDVNQPLTETKAKRAKRGFLVSFHLPDCMTFNTQQLENYDVNGTEYKLNIISDLRVIDGLVGAYTSRPCPPFPTTTFFVTKRRNRTGWVVGKLCKSSSFFVSMWRRAKRVVSCSRRKPTPSDYIPR